jgi:hypothetical protein
VELNAITGGGKFKLYEVPLLLTEGPAAAVALSAISGGGKLILKELPTLLTDGPDAAVAVMATVGVMFGAVLLITEPDVILMPVPLV